MIDSTKLLDKLLTQLTNYSNIFRKSTQPFILERLKGRFPTTKFNFDDNLIQESLIEHVGLLPIIATFCIHI